MLVVLVYMRLSQLHNADWHLRLSFYCWFQQPFRRCICSHLAGFDILQ